jgi:hypothetical protein
MAVERKARCKQGKGRHRRPAPHHTGHWLGAGALAVGLGAAMATGQGIAAAEPTSGKDSTATGDGVDTTSPAGPTAEAPSPASDTPAVDAPPATKPPFTTVSATTLTVRTRMRSTGAPITPQNATSSPTASISQSQRSVAIETAEPSDVDPARVVDEEATAQPASTTATSVSNGNATNPGVDFNPKTPVLDVNPAGSRTVGGSNSGFNVVAPEPVLRTTQLTNLIQTPPTVAHVSRLKDAVVPTDSQAQPFVPQAVTALALSPLGSTQAAPVTLRSVVTDVLTWLGLSPLAANLPVPDLPVPQLVEGLWLVVRRFQFTLNNQAPIAHPTLSEANRYTGLITGQLNADDYEDDNLTYTVAETPLDGTVKVNSDGSFTYRPSPSLAEKGGQDQFTVAIDDTVGNPAHIRGIRGLLGGPSATNVTVTLTVVAVDQTPNILVQQAREDFALADKRFDEADAFDALAATELDRAKAARDAAALLLATHPPSEQDKADAVALLKQSEQDQRDAELYTLQAAAEADRAKLNRDAAAQLLENNPTEQQKKDAAALLQASEQDERDAAAYLMQAATESGHAATERAAAIALLADHPNEQDRAQAAALQQQADQDEMDAAAYQAQAGAARQEAETLQASGVSWINEAQSLDPEADVGDILVDV